MVDRLKIEQLVKERLLHHLGQNSSSKPLDFVNEQHILALEEGTKSISVTPNAIITTLARDTADAKNIQFHIVATQNVIATSSLNPKAIAIASDHGGFALKKILIAKLKEWGYETVDLGTNSEDSVDYPDFAHAVAVMVSQKSCNYGIVIDGAGIGSSMVANKVPGVRAAHCHNIFEIKNSKEHNNANILSLGAKVIGEGIAVEMVRIWLETPFAGGRHQKRVDKIMAIENKYLRG